MAFTDNCDLYAAVHEDGINRVIHHVMRQRPSLFNYASDYIAKNEGLWCWKVDRTSDVEKYNHAFIFKIEDPIPILGADAPPVALNFCAQLVAAKIDFHPGNVIALPAEMNPPLQPQHLAFAVRLCGALDCPAPDLLGKIPPGQGETGFLGSAEGHQRPKLPPEVPPTRHLNCFCLDAFLTGHVERQTAFGETWLVGVVDDVDIVDIKPDQLEDAVNCYLKTLANVLLKEKLAIRMKLLLLNVPLLKLAKITVKPSPNPPIPNNPAIEQDQLKAFFDVEVKP